MTSWNVGIGGLPDAWANPYFISTASYDFDIFRKIIVKTWGVRLGSISGSDNGKDRWVYLGITNGTKMLSDHRVAVRMQGYAEMEPGGGSWISRTTRITVPSTVTGVQKLAFFSMWNYCLVTIPYSVVLYKE